jgi:aspartyl-tRNA(Asn)/glutamyl-tRNA(Gln) amidotransferase subunit C
MSVSRDDVRRVAHLARIALADERIDLLAAQLNDILGHMEVLRAVPEESSGALTRVEMPPLREDTVAPQPLARPLEAFAPSIRDGFFLVPRLASHDTAADRA